MSIRGDIVIGGVGARVATGLDAMTTAMCVRARKSFVRESRFVDRAGESIALARVMSVSDDLVGRERFVPLASPALAEVARPWRARFEARGQAAPPLPLLLGTPSDEGPRGARHLLASLGESAGVAIDPARSRIVAEGRAAGGTAIAQALARITDGEAEAILVGGVDTYFDPERLEALDEGRRLHGSTTENGFIPGEGAAFVLVGLRRVLGAGGNILGVSTEREPRPFGSREPCHALGMTVALERVTAPFANRTPIGWCLTDVVGERHRVEEWLSASGRIQQRLAPDLRHDTPLLLTGDVGAASVPLLVVLACIGWQTGAAPASVALIAAHSDEGERAALVLGAEASE